MFSFSNSLNIEIILASGKALVLDESAGWGPTHLVKYTPKHFSQLRTKQQEVPGTSSRIEALCKNMPIYLGQNIVSST